MAASSSASNSKLPMGRPSNSSIIEVPVHLGRRPAHFGDIPSVVEADHFFQGLEYPVVHIRLRESLSRAPVHIPKGRRAEFTVVLISKMSPLSPAAQEVTQAVVYEITPERVNRGAIVQVYVSIL
jgi:hypothetical protein